MKSKKPVSRVENSWFARVYRAEWVGPKSFADRNYGGREQAEAAAWKWVKYVDAVLPVIPQKPVRRRAKVHVREDPKSLDMKYFDVYLPPLAGEKTWSKKLYFNKRDPEEREAQRDEANRLEEVRNRELDAIYVSDMAKWQLAHAKLMRQILKMWTEVKGVNDGRSYDRGPARSGDGEIERI